jgi:hypothetical protein
MALHFKTDDPQKLLDSFKKAIKDGKIITWSTDVDGDFTHTPEQWKNKAWLRPKIKLDELTFYILRRKNTNITSQEYAVYHGRFIESMLLHCDTLFVEGSATAFPESSDNVAG